MREKLLITSKLLVKFLKIFSGLFHPVVPKSVLGKASFLMFFLLFAFTANAQLATETFESGIPATWAQANNGLGTTPFGISTDGYNLSTGAAFINPTAENIGAGNTAQYYLVTPLVNVSNGDQIKFYTKQGDATNHGNIYQIKVSTASQTDISSFTTTLATFTESDLSTSYGQKVVTFSGLGTTVDVYVAFVLINDQPGATPDANSWFIDNVSIQAPQVCDPVLAANFTVSSIGTQSAELNWTHPTTSDFQIQIVADGAPPGTTGFDTDNSYSASGLAVDTDYDVYIKAICSESESIWAGPFNLSTNILGVTCAEPIVIPDDGNTYVYAGNLNVFQNPAVTYTTQGSNCLPSTVTQNYLNGAKAFFSYTPTTSGLITLTHLITTPSTNDYGSLLVYDGCSNVGVECIAGTYNTTEGVTKVIPNLYVEAGTTYIIVASSQLTATASISFKITVSTADCPPPAVFTYSHLLQNTVSFSWDNTNNLMSNWQYAAVPMGSPAPATGTDTTTNIDNPVTGLTAGTTYDFYVRSVCGGVPGPWSLPYKFKTQCDVFPLPYSTQFTGASATAPEACWIPVDINGDNFTWTYLGGYATLQTNTFADLNNDMLVSPQVNFTGGMKRIRFKDRSTGGVSSYSIKISTTGIGASDFTTTVMPETQITNTGFVERFVYLPVMTGNVNIAFVVTPGTGSVATRISIDDVYIEDAPACPDPLNLSVGTLTTSTAELSWDPGLNETEWRVVVQPVGSGVPTVEGEVATTNVNFLADELDHSTQYEYYVRAYCNSTDQSNWVGPFNFITECGTFDVPFSEDFDNDLDTHRFCWTPVNGNGDNVVFQNFSASVTDARIQRSGFGAPPASFDDWIISPAINVVGTKELKFDYKAVVGIFFPTPRLGVEVLMSTTDTDPASFSVIMPLMEFTNTDYIEKALYINANGPVYIAFRVPPTFDTSTAFSGMQIDNVRIGEAPACPNPSAITVTNITTTSADVSWTAGFIEDQWQVVVQPAGTGVPSTGTTVDDPEYSVTTGTLTSDTHYEVYVRAYCNDTDQSEWIGPYTFKTLCDAFPSPFLETFEANSTTEQCWVIRNDNGDVNHFILNGGTNPYAGIETAGMFTGSNGENDDWLISPTITVTAGQRLRFYYRVEDSFFEEDLDILLSTTGIEPADFTEVLYSTDTDPNPLNNMEWKEKVINLTGYTGNINIAWHIPQETPNPWGYRGQLYVIDNVMIEDIPACSQPINLTVNNIADTTVQLAWESTGTETAWDVYVQPAGLGAPVGNGDPAYLTANVTNNPYTKTGLIEASQYEYYVRAVCSDTSESAWVGPFEFTTLCPLATACEYTFTITNPSSGGLSGEVQVIQNGLVVGTLDLTSSSAGATNTYTVFLCDGVEFSLLWDGIGYVPGNSANTVVTIQQGTTTIWTSPAPFGPMNDVIYEGFASCSTVTCPYPTNLSVNQNGTLSWTAGGTETQWEVYIQPVGNGTLPQSGTIVNTTPTYSPVAADFDSLTAGTYEFFVRAICGEGNESFWSGPYEFVRNDSSANAIALEVNPTETCEVSSANASFYGATVSSEPMSCAGNNNGDVWYEFEATSTAHIVELIDFSGDYYASTGNPPHPNVTLTLYHVDGTTLEEMSCSYNNAIVAAYSTATVVGDTYKIRLSLNTGASNKYTFSVCVKTPNDLCAIDAVNGSFENPTTVFGLLDNMTRYEVTSGWRYNMPDWDSIFYFDAYNAEGVVAYDGTQVIQLLTPSNPYDPSDMVNIQGIYQDFDSSEVTQYNYSYAVSTRFQGNIIQAFAGPPSGPFVLLEEVPTTTGWQFIEGTYDVPAGQNTTRIIFRAKDNGIGILLDAVSVTANNEIITQPQELDCTEESIELEARGTGMWSADENNPTEVVFTDAASSTTTVSGLIASGDYTFYWNTRYCENTIVIANVAVDDVPEVVTPVEYCEGATADPLTAPALADHTLVWYTDPVGGTALAGAPTPSTTTVGTTSYYVAYANTEGCEGLRAQIDVTINEVFVPVVGFTYDADTYCMAEANPVITLDTDFTTGGTFTATPAGLTIDAATGEIDMTTSTAGTYDITYTIEAVDCNPEGTNTVTITLNTLVTPVTGFTYAESYCIAETTNPVPTTDAGFYAGGEFTAEAGLAIDAATGEIDLTNTTAGVYNVTYAVATGDCLEGGTTTFTVTITDLAVAVVEFSYDSPSCLNSGAELVPSIAEGFTFGGTFSSTTLTVDAETGIIDLSSATQGIHDIVYTIDIDPLTCTGGGTYTTTVELTEGITPVVEFSYDSVYCYDSENPMPTTLGDFFTGGTFTSDAGLALDATTGEIDIMASTAGSYDVTYTVAMDEETCNVGGTYTTTVTIAGDLSVAITQDCRGENVWLTAGAVNGTFDSNVSYVWRNESGVAVGNSSEFNVAEYYAANGSLELPLVFTVTVTSGSCTGEASYTVETIMCQIPRGISPNGDGDNDTFDLTDLGVQEIVIFNRYGKKVFHQSNGYTNQWHGQDEKGNELPDGTYFYSINKSNGESITGWVYISREY